MARVPDTSTAESRLARNAIEPTWHQLGEPRQEDVGRVAGRVRHAEHVRDGLHLAPVPERDAGQERPRVDEERDQADRGGESGGT